MKGGQMMNVSKGVSILLFIHILSTAPCRAADTNAQLLAEAERLVGKIYNDFKTISSKKSDDISISEAKLHVTDYFTTPEMDAPYDFKYLNYNPQGYTTDTSVRRYVNEMFAMFREPDYKNYRFLYDTPKAIAKRGAEFMKDEAPPKLAQVVVHKRYFEEGNKKEDFEDTLLVSLQRMRIVKWANKASIHHIGNLDDGEIIDIERMKANAILAYEDKQYQKAYNIYRRILEKEPKDGDSYYRMAIILYKKKVYPSMKRSERMDKVRDMLRKAVWYGDSSTRDCADNMHYWVTNGQRVGLPFKRS